MSEVWQRENKQAIEPRLGQLLGPGLLHALDSFSGCKTEATSGGVRPAQEDARLWHSVRQSSWAWVRRFGQEDGARRVQVDSDMSGVVYFFLIHVKCLYLYICSGGATKNATHMYVVVFVPTPNNES